MATRLQGIGANLVGQTDAPTLLSQIEHCSSGGGGDCSHGGVELFLAIAFQRAKDLARHALRVHANEDVVLSSDIAEDEGHVFRRQPVAFFIGRASKDVRLEASVTRGKLGFGEPLSL